MQYFAPQLHPEQHSATLRASRYRKKRKTSHEQDLESADSDSVKMKDHPLRGQMHSPFLHLPRPS